MKSNQTDYASLYESCLAGIVQTDSKLRITEANGASYQLLGYPTFDAIEGKYLSAHHIDSPHEELFNFYIDKTLCRGKHLILDFPMRKITNEIGWLSISAITLDRKQPPDLDKGIVWTLVDISSRKKFEEELIQLSNTDYLTGMSNRRHFLSSAEHQISYHRRKKRPLSVLMLDIDRFKAINDNYGHAVGDDAIRLISRLCQKILRDEDLFGRLGGEEFAVLLYETELDDGYLVAERIRHEVETYEYKDGIPKMTVSLGVAELRDGEDIDKLLRRADDAMLKAKREGRNRVVSEEDKEG